jgi:hypothetical protein
MDNPMVVRTNNDDVAANVLSAAAEVLDVM